MTKLGMQTISFLSDVAALVDMLAQVPLCRTIGLTQGTRCLDGQPISVPSGNPSPSMRRESLSFSFHHRTYAISVRYFTYSPVAATMTLTFFLGQRRPKLTPLM